MGPRQTEQVLSFSSIFIGKSTYIFQVLKCCTYWPDEGFLANECCVQYVACCSSYVIYRLRYHSTSIEFATDKKVSTIRYDTTVNCTVYTLPPTFLQCTCAVKSLHTCFFDCVNKLYLLGYVTSTLVIC